MQPTPFRRACDRRLPPLVVLPQLAAPLALAGDGHAARSVFLLSVLGNAPVVLAGWLVTDGRWSRQPGAPRLAEWVRPLAAWGYGALLLGAAPLVGVADRPVLLAAAVASLSAGVIAFVFPGCSTPDGARLHERREAGTTWRHEPASFVLGRMSLVLRPTAVVALAAGRLAITIGAFALAFVTAVISSALRPRNASDDVSRRSDKESIH